jgi:hypothetical protein
MMNRPLRTAVETKALRAPAALRRVAWSLAIGALALLDACGGGGDDGVGTGTTTATSTSAPTMHILSGSGGGGGGSGGGTTAPPPVISSATSGEAFTGYPTAFGVMARSSTSEIPVITFNSGPAGMTLLSQASYGNKYGFTPYASYSVQWTPTRDQIGSHSMSFTATTKAGSTTVVIPLTVKDAPSPVSGLTAISSADGHITAHWDSTVGGIGPVSHPVRACYILPGNPALAITRGNSSSRRCDVLGPVAADQLVFDSMSQPLPDPTVYPYSATFLYDVVIVDVLGADGVAGTSGNAAVTAVP